MRNAVRWVTAFVVGLLMVASLGATASAEPVNGGPPAARAASSNPVPVPAAYVYRPSTGVHGGDKTRHDYCTKSPDSWGQANFRGPCARHDMCLDFNWAGDSTCHSWLRNDLIRQCDAAYDRWYEVTEKLKCRGVAVVYWAAVKLHTAVT